MYGGVSLAIYINGVAQELLNMVRATAPKTADGESALLDADDPELSGSAGVYRKLGQYLENAVEKLGSGKEQTRDPIKTRFVVDVISGTSAGGINGVFLAKALARNQSMKGLRQLWLSEGDLSKLLNDPQSVKDLTGFNVQKPEESLLNSQRMYRKLLEALEQMGKEPDSRAASPLVGELDLFITTTDIEGLPLPITLADNVVYERRHRNVFHFRYAAFPKLTDKAADESKDAGPSAIDLSTLARDDFTKGHDPFLAFAARCTSSFPFAFEPMRLADIEAVLPGYPRYCDDDPKRAAKDSRDRAAWDKFFSDYLRHALFDLDKKARDESPTGLPQKGTPHETLAQATAELREAFRTRSFGDGGYLDNKPFSYATSMLMRRHAAIPVDRKLLYIEPSPEHPEVIAQTRERPDFATNVQAAVLNLPRQETIREDIERVHERNTVLKRITEFAKRVDEDIRHATPGKTALPHTAFGAADLKEMIGIYGIGYGAYHRLKVREITGLLAEIVTRALGHDPASNAAIAIGRLVDKWRRAKYDELKAGERLTENEFLLQFDIRYTLRRLSFLSRRINQLTRIDERGELEPASEALVYAWLEHLNHSLGPVDEKGRRATPQPDVAVQADKFDKLRSWVRDAKEPPDERSSDSRPSAEWVHAFRDTLKELKRTKLMPALLRARAAEEVFLESDSAAAGKLREAVENLDLSWETMEPLLSDESVENQQAKHVFEAVHSGLTQLTDVVRDTFSHRSFAKLQMATDADTDPTDGAVAARLCLHHYYKNFVLYDLVTYPVQHGTGAGEANVIDIFRISPEDATSLVNERETGRPREKLAGRALMSFGAFLDEGWRRNDMLWGRLDGAERIITALLPASDDKTKAIRADLIKEAHLAILGEEISTHDVQSVCRLLSNALAAYEPASTQQQKLRALIERLNSGTNMSATMQAALQCCLDTPEKIWSYYKSDFEVNREIDPEHAVRLISRATTVTGRMLEALADKYGLEPGQRAAVWIARFGSVFWNIISVAVPKSLPHLFFRHWLAVLYVLAFIMIFGGVLLPGAQEVKSFGWKMLGLIVALNLVVAALGDYIAGKRLALHLLRAVVALSLLGLIGFGVAYVTSRWAPTVAVIGDLSLASAVAGVMLLVVGFAEWRSRLRAFIAAPTAGFDHRILLWLSVATLLVGGALSAIGPRNIVQLEFAREVDTAIGFLAQAGSLSRVRAHFALDFVFLAAYAATFAGFCLAAAKLYWGRGEPQLGSGPETKVPLSNGVYRGLAISGFVFAGAQWLAALLDAVENVALLRFLTDHSFAFALRIASWCAAIKFTLIALGAAYSAAGFIIGFAQAKVRWVVAVFAILNVAVLAVSIFALWHW